MQSFLHDVSLEELEIFIYVSFKFQQNYTLWVWSYRVEEVRILLLFKKGLAILEYNFGIVS